MIYPFTFKYDGLLSNNLLPTWRHHSEISSDGRLRQSWYSPDGLTVTMYTRDYGDGIKERMLKFTGSITWPTKVITDVWALSRQYPDRNGWRDTAKLHRLNGSLSQENDWLPFTTELTPGSYAKWAPVDGRSSSGACPFFNLEVAPGLGTIVAIGWTGQWRAEVWWGTKCEVRAGMERLNISLKPGETITSPRILTVDWEGDIEDSYNKFRRHMFKHVLPRVDGEVVVAPIAHLTTATEWNMSTEEDVWDHILANRGLGFEVAWLDAYYLRPPGFPGALGNYGYPIDGVLVDKDRYPNGLSFLAETAHDAHMEWLVWHCFEAVAPGSWMDENHPEWLLRAPDEKTALYNLGHPEALQYMKGYLSQVVRHQLLDWLRIDCCPGTKKYFEIADECIQRVGLTEIRWVEGLYSLLDRLLAEHPHLKIDNCDGGGRRIDLEMCKRSTPLWRTDYTTPVQELGDWDRAAMIQQAQIAGLSRYVPYSSCGQFYAGPYHWRSAFNGGVGVLEDCRPEFFDRKLMNDAITEGKRIRKYYAGNFYPSPANLDPVGTHWYQYHLPESDSGMLMFFKRPGNQLGMWSCIELREIDVNAQYRLWWYIDNYQETPSFQEEEFAMIEGQILKYLPLPHFAGPSSILIEYTKVENAPKI